MTFLFRQLIPTNNHGSKARLSWQPAPTKNLIPIEIIDIFGCPMWRDNLNTCCGLGY